MKTKLLLLSLSFISTMALGQKYEKSQKNNKVVDFQNRMYISTSKDPLALIKSKTLKAKELEANNLVAPKTTQKIYVKSSITEGSTSDTTHTYPWNYTTQDWDTIPIARIISYYDDVHNLVQYLILSWHNDTHNWIDSLQFFYTYNASNQVINLIQQSWQMDAYGNFSWMNVDNSTTEYNKLGQESIFNYQYWDNYNNIWVDSWKHDLTYDSNGNNTLILESYWDGSQWIPGINFINEYDAYSHITSNPIQIWDYNVNDWTNGFQYLYKYDTLGNNTSMLLQSWNFDEGTWDNCLLKTLTYNKSNKIDNYLFQYWDPFSFAWYETQRGIYKYDTLGNNTCILGQDYNPYTNTWDESWQNSYTYNDQNKQISSSSLYFDANLGIWYSGNTTKNAKFSLFDPITIKPTTVSRLEVFPNPARESVTILNNIPINQIKIFDMLGNAIFLQKYSQENVQLDITNLKSGEYLLNIKNSDGTAETKRLIKQ